MDEACEECTQNCITMHKQKKNPSPVATKFFKVMFGDAYSKVLALRANRDPALEVGAATTSSARNIPPDGSTWLIFAGHSSCASVVHTSRVGDPQSGWREYSAYACERKFKGFRWFSAAETIDIIYQAVAEARSLEAF
ncbi:hypothetical protein Tco_0204867 [Tanacetum coccineum]